MYYKFLHHEGGEALAQVAQRSCGCPLPGSVQGQVGRGIEQPGLEKEVPAHGRGGWKQMIFKVPFNLNNSMILWFYDNVRCIPLHVAVWKKKVLAYMK